MKTTQIGRLGPVALLSISVLAGQGCELAPSPGKKSQEDVSQSAIQKFQRYRLEVPSTKVNVNKDVDATQNSAGALPSDQAALDAKPNCADLCQGECAADGEIVLRGVVEPSSPMKAFIISEFEKAGQTGVEPDDLRDRERVRSLVFCVPASEPTGFYGYMQTFEGGKWFPIAEGSTLKCTAESESCDYSVSSFHSVPHEALPDPFHKIELIAKKTGPDGHYTEYAKFERTKSRKTSDALVVYGATDEDKKEVNEKLKAIQLLGSLGVVESDVEWDGSISATAKVPSRVDAKPAGPTADAIANPPTAPQIELNPLDALLQEAAAIGADEFDGTFSGSLSEATTPPPPKPKFAGQRIFKKKWDSSKLVEESDSVEALLPDQTPWLFARFPIQTNMKPKVTDRELIGLATGIITNDPPKAFRVLNEYVEKNQGTRQASLGIGTLSNPAKLLTLMRELLTKAYTAQVVLTIPHPGKEEIFGALGVQRLNQGNPDGKVIWYPLTEITLVENTPTQQIPGRALKRSYEMEAFVHRLLPLSEVPEEVLELRSRPEVAGYKNVLKVSGTLSIYEANRNGQPELVSEFTGALHGECPNSEPIIGLPFEGTIQNNQGRAQFTEMVATIPPVEAQISEPEVSTVDAPPPAPKTPSQVKKWLVRLGYLLQSKKVPPF